ncbi:anti-sigma factor domain-containing protein [Clostridium sp. D2Q-11]|uniref:Anti-sigma factor domain-containing protein n=1 Tax=Anaeromonas frigoriresistens TaxID=2683708 RepID=A0A942UY19_9FIRM|nr:anti-sigma factor domain-containing protein [Anaeromonas frigoriresistens]MBS4539081.1 anti-sigma factor domain-containing protein [Anaeromonas frigoriresistens]
MKAVVMEVMEEKLIVLTKDGRFVEIEKERKSIDIGQEISFTEKRNYNYNSNIRRFIAAAAIFIFMMTSGYGVYGYYNPFGYVNVDINPSVEIAYNLYDRVINVEGINEDGQYITEELKEYKNRKIDEVVSKVIDKAMENGYMEEDENAVLITLTDEKNNIDKEKLLNEVNEHIEEGLKDEKVVEVTMLSNTTKDYTTSKVKEISPGKMKIINKAIKVDQSLTEKELSTKSVKEIMNIIKDNKKNEKEDEKINKNKPLKNKEKLKDSQKEDKKKYIKSNNKEKNNPNKFKENLKDKKEKIDSENYINNKQNNNNNGNDKKNQNNKNNNNGNDKKNNNSFNGKK